jgi:hypothetical protein
VNPLLLADEAARLLPPYASHPTNSNAVDAGVAEGAVALLGAVGNGAQAPPRWLCRTEAVRAFRGSDEVLSA